MIRRNTTILAAALLMIMTWGCHRSPTAPAQPSTEIGSFSAEGKGGNGKGNSGGGAALLSVEMTGAIAGGPEDLATQTDNKRELEMAGPMVDVFTSIATSSCAPQQGDPAAANALLAHLNAGPIAPFRAVVVFDRTADGEASSRHRITLNCDAAGCGEQFRIGLLSPVADKDDDPKVSAGTYTYSGGQVRVWQGGAKDSVVIDCEMDSVITVTVGSV